MSLYHTSQARSDGAELDWLLPTPHCATLGPTHSGELQEAVRRQVLGWAGNNFTVGAVGYEAVYIGKGETRRKENAGRNPQELLPEVVRREHSSPQCLTPPGAIRAPGKRPH